MNSDGFNSNTSFRDGLSTDLIRDESDISAIELDATTINFDSFNLTHNGIVIPTGASSVSNPLSSTLDASLNNISNVNRLNVRDIKSNYVSAITQIGLRENELILVSDDITLNSTTLKHSTLSVYDPRNILTTPLREEIDAANNNITNLNIIRANQITSIDEAQYISLDVPDEITLSAPVNINIDAATVKINTNTVLTTSNGVSKTMDSTLNANNKNIENANVITTDSIGNATLSEAFYFRHSWSPYLFIYW